MASETRSETRTGEFFHPRDWESRAAAEMSGRKNTAAKTRNCIGSALLSKTSFSRRGYCFGPGVRYQRFYLFAPCDADCVNEKGSPAGADKQQINRCLAVREPKP